MSAVDVTRARISLKARKMALEDNMWVVYNPLHRQDAIITIKAVNLQDVEFQLTKLLEGLVEVYVTEET